MGRAHEMHAVPARLRTVLAELITHYLGDRQRGERRFQRLLQTFRQRRALGEAVVKERLGLAIVLTAQLGDCRSIGPQGGEFLEQCGCGFPLGIKAHSHRH